MKINEVEKATGIRDANIRFYEKEGLISPSRNSNGYREYSESDVRRIERSLASRSTRSTASRLFPVPMG